MTPAREFPYQDGDVTVLGPEIFASKDGAVISWRGANYVRQDESAVRDLSSSIRLEHADRPTTASVVPMTDVAEESVADRVQQLAERWKYTADRKHGPLQELLTALGEQAAPEAP